MIRNFKKYAHRDVVEKDTIWHWLSIAQHHGLPARLLDWTNSLYTALHFVTNNTNNYDIDGVIWAVDFPKVFDLLPKKLRLKLDGPEVLTINELNKKVSIRGLYSSFNIIIF